MNLCTTKSCKRFYQWIFQHGTLRPSFPNWTKSKCRLRRGSLSPPQSFLGPPPECSHFLSTVRHSAPFLMPIPPAVIFHLPDRLGQSFVVNHIKKSPRKKFLKNIFAFHLNGPLHASGSCSACTQVSALGKIPSPSLMSH